METILLSLLFCALLFITFSFLHASFVEAINSLSDNPKNDTGEPFVRRLKIEKLRLETPMLFYAHAQGDGMTIFLPPFTYFLVMTINGKKISKEVTEQEYHAICPDCFKRVRLIRQKNDGVRFLEFLPTKTVHSLAA